MCFCKRAQMTLVCDIKPKREQLSIFLVSSILLFTCYNYKQILMKNFCSIFVRWNFFRVALIRWRNVFIDTRIPGIRNSTVEKRACVRVYAQSPSVGQWWKPLCMKQTVSQPCRQNIRYPSGNKCLLSIIIMSPTINWLKHYLLISDGEVFTRSCHLFLNRIYHSGR